MQAQATRNEQNQDLLTAQQSLQSIQTLLRAGLGCITYLRNLLPADNFSESYLTSTSTPGSSLQSPHPPAGSITSEGSKRNVSGFRIMTVTRGFTEEADKLLDYLEYGIFDALQKQYLKSLIFAIYLDTQDPNNIVEAYTFNFQYYNIPGTDISVPVMSLGDELAKLSMSGLATRDDPLTDAVKKGHAPTLGEVKKSLKSLIKNLIQATTQMDALPKRRFATFKLFYQEHTPEDYEPPHFRAGDVQKDKWFFTTHDGTEIPEKCSIGQVQTGFHKVNLQISSVSAYLPSTEDNNAPFGGTTAVGGVQPPSLTPAEEAAVRAKQAEMQRRDAIERKIVWEVEDGMMDTGGAGDAFNTYIDRIPLGVRNENGDIIPLKDVPLADLTPCEPQVLFKGIQEKVPHHVGQLATNSNGSELTQTQQIEQTQILEPPEFSNCSPLSSPEPSLSLTPLSTKNCETISRKRTQTTSTLPPSDPIDDSVPSSEPEDRSTRDMNTIDTQMLRDMILANAGDTGVMPEEVTEELDMETQPQSMHMDDSIHSFSADQTPRQRDDVEPSMEDVHMDDEEGIDSTLECECGVMLEDCDCMLCDGGCKRWYHIWCMGYDTSKSDNIPTKWICFDCRVRADDNWDLIVVHDLHPRIMAKFKDLALFRRAIKVAERLDPDGLSTFSKKLGAEPIVAGQLWKRLESEGFITLQTITPDNLGILETTTRATRANATIATKNKKKTKTAAVKRKMPLRARYVFVKQIKAKKAYQDYFDPSPEIEKRLLGLEDLKPKKYRKPVGDENMEEVVSTFKTSAQESHENFDPSSLPLQADSGISQTQPETQFITSGTQECGPNNLMEAFLKRKAATGVSEEHENLPGSRLAKKVKISIGPTVDLGD